MKTRIVIKTTKMVDGKSDGIRRSEIWSGEMEILDDQEYLVQLSIIADGEPQPIVDIPFAPGLGHYVWVPPRVDAITEKDEGWYFQ